MNLWLIPIYFLPLMCVLYALYRDRKEAGKRREFQNAVADYLDVLKEWDMDFREMQDNKTFVPIRLKDCHANHLRRVREFWERTWRK